MTNTRHLDRPRFFRALSVVLLGAASLAMAPAAIGQTNYPTRDIRFIVSSSAGGTTDTLARRVAEQVSKTLGQPVVWWDSLRR